MRREPAWSTAIACNDLVRRVTITSALGLVLLMAVAGTAAEPPITAAAFAPDRQQVIVGSQRGLVLYRWPTLTEVERLPCALPQIHDLQFSPDGTRLLVAGGAPAEQGVVEVWQWPSRRRLRQVVAHSDVIYRVAWAPSGMEWTAASGDGGCSVWAIESDQPSATFTGHSRAVLAVLYLDAQRLLSGGADQTLRLWSKPDLRIERTLDQHQAAINQIAVARNASDATRTLVATVSEDRTVRLWQPEIGRLVRFTRLASIPRTIVWQDAGRRLVVASNDGRLRWLAADDLSQLSERDAGIGRIYELLDDPSSQRLLVGGERGFTAVAREP